MSSFTLGNFQGLYFGAFAKDRNPRRSNACAADAVSPFERQSPTERRRTYFSDQRSTADCYRASEVDAPSRFT